MNRQDRPDLGKCVKCGNLLEPVWAREDDPVNGRFRTILSYAVCPICGETETVDESFDGPWQRVNYPALQRAELVRDHKLRLTTLSASSTTLRENI